MNPNDLPQRKPISAVIAQKEIDRRPKVVRADHVVLERDANADSTAVVVDGEVMEIPSFAKVSCGLSSDRPLPTVTITIHAKRVLITAKRLEIEGDDL